MPLGVGEDLQTQYALLTKMGMVGSVFYVDTAANGGSDTNSGVLPTEPLLKINAAMDKCTANKGDVIQVLGNSPSSPNDTATITMDVGGVTLRGLYSKGLLSDSGFGSPTQDVPVLTIAANYVTIENLYLGVNSAGSSGGVIEFTGSNYAFTLRNCFIESQYAATYGLDITNDQPYLLVEDCVFGRLSFTNFTDIFTIGNGTDMIIRRNLFRGFSGVAINVGLNCLNLSIIDNRFVLPSNTKGKAITFANGSQNCYIDGNRANFGMTDMATNPFLDLNNDTSNTWGLNYKGVTATLPANT